MHVFNKISAAGIRQTSGCFGHFSVSHVFVCRYPEQHIALALFAVLQQNVPFCKKVACLLQKQTADWQLDDWGLAAFKVSLKDAGIVCNSESLSCVGIPI